MHASVLLTQLRISRLKIWEVFHSQVSITLSFSVVTETELLKQGSQDRLRGSEAIASPSELFSDPLNSRSCTGTAENESVHSIMTINNSSACKCPLNIPTFTVPAPILGGPQKSEVTGEAWPKKMPA